MIDESPGAAIRIRALVAAPVTFRCRNFGAISLEVRQGSASARPAFAGIT